MQNCRRNTTHVQANPTNFEGSSGTLNCVLGMKAEKLHKKLPFHQFSEKVYYHIVSEYKDGGDLYSLFKNLGDPYDDIAKDMPVKPELDDDEDQSVIDTENEIYKEEIKQFVQRKLTLRRNTQKAYGLVWGQCSSQLQEYIKGLSSFEAQSAKSNTLWLLQELKKATAGVDSKANAWMNMQDSIAMLYRMKQGPNESNEYYMDRFKANITAIELTKGSHIFYSPDLTSVERTDATPVNIQAEEERNKAILLLRNADDTRYKGLVVELRKSALLERDEYPTSIANMYEVMVKFDSKSNLLSHRQNNPHNSRRSGTVLAQQSQQDHPESSDQQLIPGSDGRTFNIKCYNCENFGHYASNCPEPSRRTGYSSVHVGFILLQQTQDQATIPHNWVLLDSCSTDSVFRDQTIISDLRKCFPNDELKMHTNGGSITYKHIGTFKHLPLQVYHNNDSIANILSLTDVMNIPGLTVRIKKDPVPSFVLKYQGNEVLFTSAGGGLFHCTIDDLSSLSTRRTSSQQTNKQSTAEPATVFTTVRDNEASLSKRELEGVKAVRDLQRVLLWPSDEALVKCIESGQIEGCSITKSDIMKAKTVYGPPVASLQGKLTRPKQHRNESTQIPVPKDLTQDAMRIKLYIDLFYVDGVAFLHTKSKDLNYITVDHMSDRKQANLALKLSFIVDRYVKRGFTITDVFADNEFSGPVIQRVFLPANVHLCARGEHVPIINRSIRTIKERARAVYSELPFANIPTIMTVSLIERIAYTMNSFYSIDSVIQQPPALLEEGRTAYKYNKPRLPFGTYAIIYAGTDNTMTVRGIPTIALRDSNYTNGFYFMSLKSGRRINCNKWSTLPTMDEAIELVEDMGKKESKTSAPDNEDFRLSNDQDPFGEVFIDEDGNTDAKHIEQSIVETREVIRENMNSEPVEVAATNVVAENDDADTPDTAPNEDLNQSEISAVDSNMFDFNMDHAFDPVPSPEPSSAADDEPDLEDESSEDPDLDIPITELAAREQAINTSQDTSASESSSQSSSEATEDTVGSNFCNASEVFGDTMYQTVEQHVFTQMSATQGIKKHGERAIAAIFKELKQLNDGVMPGKPVIVPIPFEELTDEDVRQALEAVNLIKEKRCGKLKG